MPASWSWRFPHFNAADVDGVSLILMMLFIFSLILTMLVAFPSF